MPAHTRVGDVRPADQRPADPRPAWLDEKGVVVKVSRDAKDWVKYDVDKLRPTQMSVGMYEVSLCHLGAQQTPSPVAGGEGAHIRSPHTAGWLALCGSAGKRMG